MGRPQTMVELTIAGKGLTPYLGYPVVICQSLAAGGHATGEYIRVDLVADTAQNNDTKLSGIISIFPTAPSGTYEVFLTDSSGTKLFDIGQKFTVRSPNDGAYADCPTKSGPVAGDKDLFCSQALLDYHQTREIFGKGVADRYIVAQVTVRNLSDDFEYVLHDIRLGTTQAVVASIDRKLVRGLAQKTEQFSAAAKTASDSSTPIISFGGRTVILFTTLMYRPFPQPASITVLSKKKLGIAFVQRKNESVS